MEVRGPTPLACSRARWSSLGPDDGVQRHHAAGRNRGPGPTRTVVAVLFGVDHRPYAVRHVLVTLLALALLLGIFWIVNGTVELFTALSRRAMACRAWTGLMGAFSVFAGLRRLCRCP
jgi:uncharacterized membrane protein HdeD (DUF308 family)